MINGIIATLSINVEVNMGLGDNECKYLVIYSVVVCEKCTARGRM